MLGTNDTAAENAATSLLYAGEQYDSDLSQYYLRARYYNPWSGTFNRMDDFAGNNQDPQSLHKYLYCHANPINNIDPSGMISNLVGIAIIAICIVALIGIRIYKQWRVDSMIAAGATVITPGTHEYRSMEISLSFLSDAVSIPGTGVQQSDVNGMRTMLQNGDIYRLRQGAGYEGLSAFGNIYINLWQDAASGAAHRGLTTTNYTVANYPNGTGFESLYWATTTLWHEWQHHHYGAGARKETTANSRNWSRTYGKEVILATGFVAHLNSLPASSVVDRNDKIGVLNDVITSCQNP